MSDKWKKFIPLMILAGLALVGAGIYIIVNHIGMVTRTNYPATAAGFWNGLWHGLIVILAFIASWFDRNIILYQAYNNGFWYNLGYIIGLAIALGGAKNSQAQNKQRQTKTTAQAIDQTKV